MARRKLVILAAASLTLLVVVAAVLVLDRRAAAGPHRGISRTMTDSIGEVLQGQTVEHVFVLGNDGPTELVIKDAIPWAGTIVSVDSVIPAGGEGRIKIRLETRKLAGQLNELVKVHFADEKRVPIWLQLRGRVVLLVQLEPSDRVYFFTVKGDTARKQLEVINHQQGPLAIVGVSASDPLFQVQSEALEAGQRYRVTVTLDPAAPVGDHRAIITVKTDSRAYATLEIRAWARVKDVVHTSISRIDFSALEYASLNLEAVSRRTVLVEKDRGTDFRVLRATTDVPFLSTQIEPQKPGQSYLVHVQIMRDRVKRGIKIVGTLVIETNDPAFRRLELPITGSIP